MLRSNYGKCMLQLMAETPGAPQPAAVQAVLDVGCAAGLSSLALRELFPAAHITGVDLSPHMVAVGRYHQEQREVSGGLACAVHLHAYMCLACACALHLTCAGW
jgi:predicted TPR repeat methyltransferase